MEEDFPGVKALASMGVVLILGKMGVFDYISFPHHLQLGSFCKRTKC